MVEVAYVGTQGRQMMVKMDINQAPPMVGVSNANINRPFIAVAPKLRSVGRPRALARSTTAGCC